MNAVRVTYFVGKPAYALISKVDDAAFDAVTGLGGGPWGVAKTIADCFRHRRKVGQTVALEGLQKALRQRKASPAEIARHAARRRRHGGSPVS